MTKLEVNDFVKQCTEKMDELTNKVKEFLLKELGDKEDITIEDTMIIFMSLRTIICTLVELWSNREDAMKLNNLLAESYKDLILNIKEKRA